MNDKRIQRQILEILNEFNDENPGYHLARSHLMNKLKIDNKTLEKNVLYLHKEKYVDIGRGLGVSFNSVKITDKGIDLVENQQLFDSEFSTDITASTVQNSQMPITSNVSIENSFNEIYNTLNSLNLENKDEIRRKVSIIQEELKKDTISKSKIKSSTKWLKRNASWTILPLAQIIMMSYGLNI